MFKKAQKNRQKFRIVLHGDSTLLALMLASSLVVNEPFGVIESEKNASLKYCDMFNFDILDLANFSLAGYLWAIEEAINTNYRVIVINSISNELNSLGGVLSVIEKKNLRDAIIDYPGDVVITTKKLNQDTNRFDDKEYNFLSVDVSSSDFNFTSNRKSENEVETNKNFWEWLDLKPFNYQEQESDEILEELPESKPIILTTITEQQLENQNYPQPPKLWEFWTTVDDAIQWALTILPDANYDFLNNTFKQIPRELTKDERGKLWVQTINSFAEGGDYNKK